MGIDKILLQKRIRLIERTHDKNELFSTNKCKLTKQYEISKKILFCEVIFNIYIINFLEIRR